MTANGKKTVAREPSSNGTWLMAVVTIGLGLVAFRLLGDVFSVAGLAYTLGGGDGHELMWPAATVFLTWMIVIEIAAAAGVVADYLAGERRSGWLATWAFGHVRTIRLVAGLLIWTARHLWRFGVWFAQRYRMPAAPAARTDEEDFDVFEIPAVADIDDVAARSPERAV